MQVTLKGQRLFMAPFLEGDHRVTLHATTNLQYTLKTFCVVNLSIENGCKISVCLRVTRLISPYNTTPNITHKVTRKRK